MKSTVRSQKQKKYSDSYNDLQNIILGILSNEQITERKTHLYFWHIYLKGKQDDNVPMILSHISTYIKDSNESTS